MAEVGAGQLVLFVTGGELDAVLDRGRFVSSLRAGYQAVAAGSDCGGKPECTPAGE